MAESSRDYTQDEQKTLATNLFKVSEQIHRAELSDRAPTVDLLCWIHSQLFQNVRDHAGRIRRAGFGSDRLTFGPNRSISNSEVPNQLLDVFSELQRALPAFDQNRSHPAYERSVFRLVAWAQAEIIRIHPFEDGNGRSTRAFANWLFIRLGLAPIAYDIVRQEYLNCLNHYYREKDLQPLIDLTIRVATGG